MFAVISGVLFAFITKKPRLVIDAFQDDCSVYKFSNISEILDLKQINQYTSKEYNVILIDRKDITEDLSDVKLVYSLEWITNINKRCFDAILQNVHFAQRFMNMASPFIQKLNPNSKINVFHLRMEDDSFPHFCTYNNITPEEFRQKLSSKYIEIITAHVDKSDTNIILSYSTDNEVIQFMKENGYTYIFNEKYHSIGREQNAIVDTIVSKTCNNIFIGNFNLTNVSGSTFSYFVAKRLNEGVKCVFVDIPYTTSCHSIDLRYPR